MVVILARRLSLVLLLWLDGLGTAASLQLANGHASAEDSSARPLGEAIASLLTALASFGPKQFDKTWTAAVHAHPDLVSDANKAAGLAADSPAGWPWKWRRGPSAAELTTTQAPAAGAKELGLQFDLKLSGEMARNISVSFNTGCESMGSDGHLHCSHHTSDEVRYSAAGSINTTLEEGDSIGLSVTATVAGLPFALQMLMPPTTINLSCAACGTNCTVPIKQYLMGFDITSLLDSPSLNLTRVQKQLLTPNAAGNLEIPMPNCSQRLSKEFTVPPTQVAMAKGLELLPQTMASMLQTLKLKTDVVFRVQRADGTTILGADVELVGGKV